MELWPAIDLRGGRCVRLVQGDFAAETVFGDPIEQALAFEAAGATRLHVVDLDAARTGVAANRDLVIAIARRTGLVVQAGGGVRDEAAAGALFDGGVARVIVGTVAVERPELVADLAERWPGRVLVGLDHRSRRSASGGVVREVAVRGWVDRGGVELGRALDRVAGVKLGGLVVTDIARDGTGTGPDLEGLAFVLGATSQPVIASGGAATADDLRRLGELEVQSRRLDGAIVGRALLSGQLTVADALVACGR